MEKASIEIIEQNDDQMVFRLRARDASIVEHNALFRLVCLVEVHHSEGIDSSTYFFDSRVEWDSNECIITAPLPADAPYSYNGKNIDIRLMARLTVNDAMIFDTKVIEPFELPLERPPASRGSGQVIEPDDVYSFFANVKAVPARAKLIMAAIALAMLLLCIVPFTMFIVNLIHPFIPPRSGVDPNVALTFVPVIMVFFFIFFGYGYFKRQLLAYLDVSPGPAMGYPVLLGEPVNVSELIDGKSLIDLDELTVRVVAANLECGQYQYDNGSTVRTVSFRRPSRGLVLYETRLENIKAGETIASRLTGETVSFDEMFRLLYPPNMVKGDHGLDLGWEVQFIHPDLMDIEVSGSNDIFDYQHFLKAADATD